MIGRKHRNPSRASDSCRLVELLLSSLYCPFLKLYLVRQTQAYCEVGCSGVSTNHRWLAVLIAQVISSASHWISFGWRKQQRDASESCCSKLPVQFWEQTQSASIPGQGYSLFKLTQRLLLKDKIYWWPNTRTNLIWYIVNMNQTQIQKHHPLAGWHTY